MRTSTHRFPKPDARSILQARFDQAFQDQTSHFGDHPWTAREFSLIDAAQKAVQRSISAADHKAFDLALAVFLRRTTPLDVLADASAAAPGDIALWVSAIREMADRTGAPKTLTVQACARLGHQDLVFRVLGEPGEAEFSIDELPSLLGVGQACKTDQDLEAMLLGVLDIRRAFGGQVIGWRAE